MGLFKKVTTKEKIASRNVNFAGEKMDRLDADGNLPFGWVVHNKNYVDMIDREMQVFRKAIYEAETDVEKYGALKSFLLYLQDGKKHYAEMGECVGKYFEEYACKSVESIKRKKEFEKLEKKLTGQE